MDRTIYKRLNDNAIICIHKYKNKTGCVYHDLSLYYEDTDTLVQLDTLLMKSKIHDWEEFDEYHLNNNYVVIMKYNESKKILDVSTIYDISKRQNIMIEDEWANFFNYMSATDDIVKNRLKVKRLGKKISIK